MSLAVEHGVAIPAFSSSLSYYDGLRRSRGPANLLQGLRDYFGAHTYRRLDQRRLVPHALEPGWQRGEGLGFLIVVMARLVAASPPRNDGGMDIKMSAVIVIASEAKQSRSPASHNSHWPMRNPFVYIMASQRNGTVYTGVTSDLSRRVFEHQHGLRPGFTKRNDCKLLVWYKGHPTMPDAIAREKQIKGGSRTAKLRLIEARNPTWSDLTQELV